MFYAFINFKTRNARGEYTEVEPDTLVTPIKRDYFVPYVRRVFNNTLPNINSWCIRRPGYGNEEEQAQIIDAAIARLAIYNEMPVTPPFMIPSGLFADLLDTYLRTPPGGLYSAQQVARELHNRVSLWLIE